MEEEFKVIDNYLMVRMPAEVDHHASEYIGRTADRYILKEGVGNVVFDFEKTRFMDSSGIAVILKTDRLLRQTGGALALCGVPRQVRRVLDVAGLTNIVPVLEDRAKECEQC